MSTLELISKNNSVRKIYVSEEEQWIELRRKGIGGSDAGAVCGVNPWKSPVQVWLDKTGRSTEFEDNERMMWGRKLEDVVADHFAEVNGIKIRRNNAVLIHPEIPYMLANIDREIVGEKALLEVKTAGAHTLKTWESDGAPASYQLQVQHYMAVTGYATAYLAVLIGGQKYMQFIIKRDDEVIQYLAKIESDFWKFVTTNTAPPMDESSLTASTLNALYPTSNGQCVILPDEAAALLAEYELYSEAEKKAKKSKEQTKMQIQALMGEAELGIVDSKMVKWKTTTRKAYEVSESTYRDFRIANIKEGKDK